jgi:hypothetical protein
MNEKEFMDRSKIEGAGELSRILPNYPLPFQMKSLYLQK